MRERTLITRVVLENYKSIAFCDVKLGPLAILVGPNGAGKSNFLDALRFLSDCMTSSVGDAFYGRSGFPHVLRQNGSAAVHLGIRIEFETLEGLCSYTLRFKEAETEGYAIEREKCTVGGQSWEARGGVLLSESGAPLPALRGLHLPFMAVFPRFGSALRALSQCHFYNLSVKDFRAPIPAGVVERVLRSDGANLTNVLDHIWRKHPAVHERIIQYLRVLYPTLISIESVEFGGFRNLEFLLSGSATTFSPIDMSDGTLRALAVLIALFQANAGAENVSLVGLEEPEAALHPAAAGVLFDALREASLSVQVLATTHSADLLDKKEIEADSILSVALEDGATRIGPVDKTGREVLKRQLYTAGELMRMNHLQPNPTPEPRPEEIESVLFGDLVSA